MKLITLHLCPLISFVSVLGTVALPVYSQPIAPANDGTGTTVNQNGNQFNIQGGTHNGTNLFHSFGKFNLNSGQTANFISTPDTRNILGRITGGDPSIINGLIQVIGGNSNLFLMNPAGVMFGQNASLNIPASFSVTTATGIGFNSNNFWFQAIGTNDYSNLVGNPSGYNFNVSNPGAIVNEGILSLNPGKDLTLAGGTVINTGELSTAGGNITIAAVEGENILRISQPGHLLSLDVSPTSHDLSEQSITPMLLPELLTGSDIHHASSVVMNAQGNLELTDTAGVAIASGNIDVSDTSRNGSVGGQINVLGDRVAVIDANINANSPNVGGKILIGGDFQGNGIVPNSRQTFVNNNSIISADAINNGDGGQVIIWSDNTTNFAGNISAKGGDFSGDGGFVEISGKEQLIFDGNVNVSAAFGETGTILFDPKNINIGGSESSNEPSEENEDDNVTFSVEEIEELEGEIILQADNDITVNEQIQPSESIELKAGRNININADIDTSQNNSNISLFGNDNSADINNREPGAGSINQREGTTLNSGSGDIIIKLGELGANGDINLANLTTTGQLLINANQGNIRQVSPNSLITADRAIFETQNSGGIGLAETPLQIDVNNLEVLTGEQGLFINSVGDLTIGGVSEELTGISTKGGGNIELNINGNLTANEEVVTSVPDRQPGTITISSNGNINTTETTLKSNSESTTGGDIFLSADGNIQTGNINASTKGNERGGNITINSGGEIDTTAGEIFSASFDGDGGNVSITSQGDLKTGNIDSRSEGSGNGGDITLESTGGNVDTSIGEIASLSQAGNAGSVTIKSQGDINTGNIDSNSQNGNGGDIALESINGNIDTSIGEIASLSQAGNAGNVSITSNSDLKTSDIDSRSTNGRGGNIALESINGNIDTSIGEIASLSQAGNAGSVTIKSQRDINTGNIDSNSINGNGGNIFLESIEGNINTTVGELASLSQAGNAGNVTLESNGNLITGKIDSRSRNGNGGNITLESISGNVDTTGGEIASLSQAGNAGGVNIKAFGDINTGNIDSQTEAGQGGNITIESISGNVDTSGGEIFSGSVDGNSGNVALTSNGDLITDNIDSRSTNGRAGNITLESIGANIDTSAGEVRSSSRRGNAGTVSLTSQGDIKTGSILSFAGRGTDEVEESEDSQNQNGSSNGGDITLKAGGTIDTNAGANDRSKLESFSREGAGGNISLEANGDITTAKILSTAGDPQASNPEDNSNITPLTETEINERSSGNIRIESMEGAVTTTEEINSFATSGNGGSVTIRSRGNLTTSDINSRSDVNGRGGNITLESTDGNIDTTNGDRGISSFSELGNAGDVTITSNGNLTTGDIDSRSDGDGQGGKITLESLTGNIDSSPGRLFSFSELGDAGDVTITSNGNLTTGDIDSRSKGSGQGGKITLESTGGNIETTGGELSSFSELGNAGDVTITSSGNLTIGETNSSSKGSGLGGNITLESTGGNIETTGGELSSFSELGNAGNVTITSNGNLTTGDINSSSKGSGLGGNITLESLTGNVDTTDGELESFSRSGNAGNVTITSSGNLTTGDIFSSSGNPRDSNNEDNSSEDVSVSEENSQQTDNSNSGENTGGAGGSITLIAEGEINTTAGLIESFSRRGEGGDISLEAKGNITTSEIISSAGDPENIRPKRENTENTNTTQSQLESETGSPGGDITIQSIEGNVTTQGELISYSNQGDGGNVSIISNGNVNTAGIDSRADRRGRGGSISIQSQTGTIEAIGGELASSSRTGDGGNIEIIGTDNILVETIFSESEGDGNGGDVTITGNGDIKTGSIESFAGGSGQGGNISIFADGAIDASIGELNSFSELGAGGNITLSATGDIITGFIESFSGAGARGGNITLDTINGNIDTTVGFLGEEVNIPTDADVSSEDVATTFEQERANLSSYAPEGTGGNIVIIQRGQGEITTSNISSFGGESSGGVSISNNDGNINTGVIFSTGIGGIGDRISIETLNNGDLNINHIATYSSAEDGTGGNIKLNASGVVNINNVASFGNAGSGDVSIVSNSGSINTGTIQTRAPNGTSGNITLNTFSTQGDIRTANVSTEGGEAAGTVEIIAPDGSVTTEDLESISESGNAGGIDIQAGEDIETGDQTVDSATGDASINNEAGGDITTGDQVATTEQGDASINNEAGGDITTGDQTATTEQGDASINNEAGGDITTGDQTATTEQGDASINNQAGGNITTGDQIATTEQGDASINNQAGGDITTGDQIAIGDTTNISNLPGGELNTGEIIQISPPPSIDNNLSQQLPQIQATPVIPTTANPVQQTTTPVIPTTANPVQQTTTPVIPTTANPVQPTTTPAIPTTANLVQPTTTPATPTTANPVQPTTTPAIPTNNILQSNNPISNPIATNIIQSVQSNSTISTTNNPNLPNKKSDRQQISINTDTTTALQNINIINNTPLTVAANSQTLTALEQNRNNEFTDHFGEDLLNQNTSIKNIREVLTDTARQTGKNSAIIYVTAYQEELQLILYTSDSDPILKTFPAAHREQLMEVVLQLRVQVTAPSRRNTQSYLPPAQKLYNWLIRPISAELEAANIDTLLFSMDEGLRTLPVAALHDGKQFLVEKYSLSLIPSISLMDTNYRPIQDTRVLAMGASEFIAQNSLPAVPVELKTISQQLWKGSQFLNQDFTRNNLLTQRQNYPYPIIHLATHAEFRPGAISNSYIQLWGDEQLQLDEMRQLGWNDPPVELLVLSACRTAVGDKNAELGFAGLAVAAGAKSALASVWYVSDEGTLGLMTEFYTQLNNAKIKAEALRQAQLAMLRGEVVIAEGQLRGTAARGAVALPSELGKFENQNLSHPYYWAGFMMIGSPW